MFTGRTHSLLPACMKLVTASMLAILATACASLAADHRSDQRSSSLAITNVSIVDVDRGTVRPGMTVVIHDQAITSVRTGVSSGGARQIDGTGKFLIPGLWDMHTHHQASGRESLGLFVANGVLGTRDMGSELSIIQSFREDIARGATIGPAIIASGPVLDAAPRDWPWRLRVEDSESARAAVRALKNAGADFIKVHDNTPRDAFFAIASEARSVGLPFAGHVPVRVTIAEAAESGIASIEHLSNSRVFIECSGGITYKASACEPFFRLLAARGVWQTPTFVFFQGLPGMVRGQPIPHHEYASQGQLDLWRKNLEASNVPEAMVVTLETLNRENLVAARDLMATGSNFLAGSDGLVAGFSLHDELEWMVRAGFSPLEALRTATINPARFLGRESTSGAIGVGKEANLVLLDANPLEDIRNSRRITGVILNGHYLVKAQLDRMIADARRAH